MTLIANEKHLLIDDEDETDSADSQQWSLDDIISAIGLGPWSYLIFVVAGLSELDVNYVCIIYSN